VNVWTVALASAASRATVVISVAASRSDISQPDDSSTRCFGPGTARRPRTSPSSDRTIGNTVDCMSS
jgi:hypothetical protein